VAEVEQRLSACIALHCIAITGAEARGTLGFVAATLSALWGCNAIRDTELDVHTSNHQTQHKDAEGDTSFGGVPRLCKCAAGDEGIPRISLEHSYSYVPPRRALVAGTACCLRSAGFLGYLPRHSAVDSSWSEVRPRARGVAFVPVHEPLQRRVHGQRQSAVSMYVLRSACM